MGEDRYWQISGPRLYLNIPTPVPNYWCARLSFHFPSKRPDAVGWGATMEEAMRDAEIAAQRDMEAGR